MRPKCDRTSSSMSLSLAVLSISVGSVSLSNVFSKAPHRVNFFEKCHLETVGPAPHSKTRGITMTTATMKRVVNFYPGPAALPLPVLERAQKELVDFGGTGMSVMELSHRSPEFEAVLDRAEKGLRRLMKIPDTYAVLFL